MSATSNTQPDQSNLPADNGSARLAQPTKEPIVEAMFGSSLTAINDDLEQRVEIHANEGHWQTTRIPGLSICVLEYISGDQPRMTALIKLGHNNRLGHDSSGHNAKPEQSATLTDAEKPGTPERKSANLAATEGVQIPAIDLELLVQHGLVADDDSEYLHPFYIRQPTERNGNNQNFTLHPGSKNAQTHQTPIEFYIATGQLAHTDKQKRCINLNDHNLWLPGPVEKTEVMPLHMHEGNNSMLVRWLDTTSFKPRLDPLGEEVLVITGTLKDEKGSYSAGSWIRNPVSAWQAWSGEPGTLIYYKNGHFS